MNDSDNDGGGGDDDDDVRTTHPSQTYFAIYINHPTSALYKVCTYLVTYLPDIDIRRLTHIQAIVTFGLSSYLYFMYMIKSFHVAVSIGV